MKTQPSRVLLFALTLALCAGPAAQAYYIPMVEALFIPDSNRQKHPKSASLAMVITEELLGTSQVCVGYQNISAPNRGRILATVEILKQEASIRLQFAGAVRKNQFFKCKVLARPLFPGDLVNFSFQMVGFKRLKKHDHFSVLGSVGSPAPSPPPARD